LLVRIRSWICLVMVALTLTGCTALQSSSAKPYRPDQIMKYDASAKTAYITLVAGADSGYGGFNFDGYSVGQLSIKIPLGWKVYVSCKNNSSVFTHTCAIVQAGPITPTGGKIVFGATSPHPLTGLPYGAVANYSFTPNKLGKYRISCTVIGHEADGMWDWFYVTKSGLPSISV